MSHRRFSKRSKRNSDPSFIFGLSPDEPPLIPENDLWSKHLPVSRHAFNPSSDGDAFSSMVTYGDYFTAVRQWLSQDRCSLLCHSVGTMLGRRVVPSEINRIGVYLVKHGAFYHPAQIIVQMGSRQLSFVLNVAISPTGQQTIHQEFHSLMHLRRELTQPFWPMVYGIGKGMDSHGRLFPMFLGQWLEGYYEFHLSGNPGDPLHLMVWDTVEGHHPLTDQEAMACLHQAACILTYAYNPVTFQRIGPWHHAAGDFVVALHGDIVQVRLISVRQYAPMIESPEPDAAVILEALFIFLLTISIQLRLDRMDGIGAVACYGTQGIAAICKGFFEGLRLAAAERGLPDDFDATVRDYFALHSMDQWISLAEDIMNKLPLQTVERDMFAPHLESHVAILRRALGRP